MKIKVGDKVELLRTELLDDYYKDHLRTRVVRGTVMRVVAIAPKVRMIKGEGYDGNKYFVNLVVDANEQDYPRVRTNFCNVRKVK